MEQVVECQKESEWFLYRAQSTGGFRRTMFLDLVGFEMGLVGFNVSLEGVQHLAKGTTTRDSSNTCGTHSR